MYQNFYSVDYEIIVLYNYMHGYMYVINIEPLHMYYHRYYT